MAIDLLASSQAESLLQHLDRFVFTEDLQIRLLSAGSQTLWVQFLSPRSSAGSSQRTPRRRSRIEHGAKRKG